MGGSGQRRAHSAGRQRGRPPRSNQPIPPTASRVSRRRAVSTRTTFDPATTLDEFAAISRSWLESVLRTGANIDGETVWGHGSDDVAVFHALAPADELELLRRGSEWQRQKLMAGFGAINWPIQHGGAGLTDFHAQVFPRGGDALRCSGESPVVARHGEPGRAHGATSARRISGRSCCSRCWRPRCSPASSSPSPAPGRTWRAAPTHDTRRRRLGDQWLEGLGLRCSVRAGRGASSLRAQTRQRRSTPA